MERKRVLLGFSGGIDSTSAVGILQGEGYDVVALTIDTLLDNETIAKAERVAKELGIEWHLYNGRECFEREIVNYFCEEYAKGRTPAPCTRCNSLIKWTILEAVANDLGIEHIATGHYFNIEKHDGNYYVAKGIDPAKDQSYYLWGLSQGILRRALTPMGNLIKSEVKEAFRDKSESMGICFLQRKHYTEFLESKGIKMVEGDIVNEQGILCGRHNGIARYTIGQRRGEGLKEGMRVVDIDGTNNTIIVGEKASLYKSTLIIKQFNIVNRNELLTSDDITLKIRGIGLNPERPITIREIEDGLIITSPDPTYAPAKGQPVVFYRKNLVIGGGIIESFE
ncbi:MAG: tRNA 2-thiouridine(34) synthase MnmA [Alistipes sp.]|nr:tRNA 2-thiouridine(34) synthase MnmA [Alistipes sp.]